MGLLWLVLRRPINGGETEIAHKAWTWAECHTFVRENNHLVVDKGGPNSDRTTFKYEPYWEYQIICVEIPDVGA